MGTYENFISYRRSDSSLAVKNIYDALLARGYNTFCDVYTLGSGKFGDELLKTIENSINFIVVLSPSTFDRCENEDDWLTKEIVYALEKEKNIIPIFVDGFVFPKSMPLAIEKLSNYNGLNFDVVYFEFFIDRLVNMFLFKDEASIIFEDADTRDFITENDQLIKYVGHSKNVKIPENILYIGEYAFKDHTEIEKILFPTNLIEIRSSAFERCLGLASVILPDSIISISPRAFNRCFNVNYLSLGKKLISIGDEAFSFCSNLKNIRIGPSVERIAASAFNNCTILTEFVLEESNKHFSTIDGILYDKHQTVLIRCPEGYSRNIVDVPTTVAKLGPWAFAKCIKVEDIRLPYSLTEVAAHAFEDCYNIRQLSLGDNVALFDLTAINGWSRDQRILTGNRFNPAINYSIQKKLKSQFSSDIVSEEKQKPILVKTTFESKNEAEKMARMLLDKKLIVAGQISKLHSIYIWDLKINSENEFELSCITNIENYQKIEKFIKENHSYELCQIIAIPIIHTSNEFLGWINEYVKK